MTGEFNENRNVYNDMLIFQDQKIAQLVKKTNSLVLFFYSMACLTPISFLHIFHAMGLEGTSRSFMLFSLIYERVWRTRIIVQELSSDVYFPYIVFFLFTIDLIRVSFTQLVFCQQV